MQCWRAAAGGAGRDQGGERGEQSGAVVASLGAGAGVAAVAGVGQQLAEAGHHLRVGGVDVLRLARVVRQVVQLVVVRGVLLGAAAFFSAALFRGSTVGVPTRSTSFQSPARMA